MPAPSYGLAALEGELEVVTARLTADLLPFGFDIETGYEGESREEAQLHPEENLISGFSLTNSLAWARYVPVQHDTGVNLDPARAAELIWPLFFLTDAEGLHLCVTHGGIFEKRCLARFFTRHLAGHPVYGEQVRALGGYIPLRSDTQVESYAEGINTRHGLKPVTEATFPEGDPTRRRQPGEPGRKMMNIMELFPDGLTQKQQNSIRFNVLDQHDPKVYSYACEDALWTLANHRLRFPAMRNNGIYKLEMALLEEVLPAMSDFGVWYDWDMIREGSRKAHEFLPLYETDVRAAFEEATGTPCDINFASPKQMQKLIFEDMGMPVIKRTNKGAPSTNAKEVLVNFTHVPAIAKFMEWKELETLCNNFLDSYPVKYTYAPDGMTHPNFIQHGSAPGRGAHDNPNYAQTSKKKYHLETRDGHVFEFSLRMAIGAPPGYYMVGFDYSMMELRVIAGEAQEEGLLQAFSNGEDMHKKTAALVFGVPLAEVTDEQRQFGKTSNFSLGYGQTARSFAKRAGCSPERGEEISRIYHASYPKLNPKRQQVIADARRDGYIITKFGRRVPLPDISSSDRRLREAAERTAGNAFVQGPGTGDYPKMAMVRAVRALKAAGLADKVHLVMNIHDALEFYAREDVPPALVIRVLEPAVVFPVPGWPPIVADWHVGRRWGDLREVRLTPDGTLEMKKGKPKPPPAPEPDPRPASMLAPVDFDDEPEREPLTRAAPPGEQARTVFVDVRVVPGVEAFRKLQHLAASIHGGNTVILSTPDGTVRLPGTSGLRPDHHQASVAVLIPGAVLRYDTASVDMAALGNGLAL
jgi:DNA polymerase I-like protein with 3'-5' exonuclease and polymerase domains